MKIKEILDWPEGRDLVRFLTVSIITGHLHRKIVFWETTSLLYCRGVLYSPEW